MCVCVWLGGGGGGGGILPHLRTCRKPAPKLMMKERCAPSQLASAASLPGRRVAICSRRLSAHTLTGAMALALATSARCRCSSCCRRLSSAC